MRGLQALPSSQGRWIPGTAATILEASALLQLYINGAISQIRQGYPLRDLRIALIKRVIIINAGGAGVPGSKAIFRRLFCLQKQRGLGQRLCCERAAGFALKPGTPDSRNCSSYSGGLCLTKTLYKGSHFTKPARVSLPSPPDRINKTGDNNKRRRGGGGVPEARLSSEDSLESKSKWASRQRLCCERVAGFGLKPGTLDSRNCSNYSGGLCFTATLHKRSHFTKPAGVSLTRLPDRINKTGDNNKPRRGRGVPEARHSSEDSLESKSKWASRQRLCCERAAGFALKPGTLDSRNCSSYS